MQSNGLTPEQTADYLYHSFTRVDGLWFVLAEEKYGFDAALALDKAVWQVVPKLQARFLARQMNLTRDLPGLATALRAKLGVDRYEFTLVNTAEGLELSLTTCPWHELIVKSGRAHIAERVGGVICGVELPVFAKEFGYACSGAPNERLCRDGKPCRFVFQPLVTEI